MRLIIIVLISMALSYMIFEKQDYTLSVVLLIMLICAAINIVRYFNIINRWIAFAFLGIENDDTTMKAPSKTGNEAIDNVYSGVCRINELFKQTRIDICTQEKYFRSVIDQSATGLFSINEKGRVININPAAEKLTKLHHYHHVNILAKIDDALPQFIMQSNKNQQSAIFENQYGQKLLFKFSEIRTQKEIIRLVAVSDITKEMDNGEVEAWIKLARTLSHEIMNNIAPITTLSQVISEYYTQNNKIIDVKDVDSKTITNTVRGLSVIEERSVGLMNFVGNYRKFTKLPVPQPKVVNLSQLIENNLVAASTFCGFSIIELEKSIPEDLELITDDKLLSQVVINLLKNACEALTLENVENPKITVKLKQTNSATKLEITNNGPAIPPEIREQIFIPFFTTKDDGSGIGLSLSKQIMLKMDGDILLNSNKDNNTTFTIVLN